MGKSAVKGIMRAWKNNEVRKPPEMKAKDLALESANAKLELMRRPNPPEVERELAAKISNSEHPGLAAKELLLAKRRNGEMAVKDGTARRIIAEAIGHAIATEMLLGNMVEAELTRTLCDSVGAKEASEILSAHAKNPLNLSDMAVLLLHSTVNIAAEMVEDEKAYL